MWAVKRAGAVSLVLLLLAISVPRVHAQSSCSRVVIFTLPSVTWTDVARYDLPALDSAIDSGAAGSVSVRTISSRTTYASGFATIGGGTRIDGSTMTGGTVTGDPETEGLVDRVVAAGVDGMEALAADAGYDAVPGALAAALGDIPTIAIGSSDIALEPPVPLGYGKWSLLAAMDPVGSLDRAAVHSAVLEDSSAGVISDSEAMSAALDEALTETCAVTVVDPGDLVRADYELTVAQEAGGGRWVAALETADDLLEQVIDAIDPARDLLIVVSPTSPLRDRTTHFGVAVAVGPGFPPGASLTSATTRRPGIVTLPDVAPSVTDHLGLPRPDSMLGRAWTAVAGDGDRLNAALALDRESGFVDRVRAPIWTGFVAAELVVYGLMAFILWRRRKEIARLATFRMVLEAAAFVVLAFPLATFVIGGLDGYELGSALYVSLLVGIAIAVAAVAIWIGRDARQRIGLIAAATTVVLLADLIVGSRLQMNTVFSYSPIVAGRFSGIGNIAFAVLGAATVITGALIIDRWGRGTRPLAVVAALFVAVVAIDGAPAFGSDIGGVLALVPSLGITWLLLAGRRPRVSTVVVALGATVVVVAGFLIWDLNLPEESRTHLGRFFEDIRARGFDVFSETVTRKIRANLRVFTSTIWTYLVPPLLIFVGWLLTRPRGRWEALRARYPAIRAGIIGGLLLAVLGFAVNDSGIVVPAVILSMLVPVALVIHLRLEREEQS